MMKHTMFCFSFFYSISYSVSFWKKSCYLVPTHLLKLERVNEQHMKMGFQIDIAQLKQIKHSSQFFFAFVLWRKKKFMKKRTKEVKNEEYSMKEVERGEKGIK